MDTRNSAIAETPERPAQRSGLAHAKYSVSHHVHSYGFVNHVYAMRPGNYQIRYNNAK